MIASPPIETAVEMPSPDSESALAISTVMPPERDITPILPGLNARSVFAPPTPPTFDLPGEITPRQFGPMMRTFCCCAYSTNCATCLRGMRSVTTTISLMPASIASKTASAANAGGTETTEASTRSRAVKARTVSSTGTPCTSRPLRPGVTPPTQLRAVVEHLAGHRHGLAAGDALDDEGGVLVDQDGHRSCLACGLALRLRSGRTDHSGYRSCLRAVRVSVPFVSPCRSW